MTNEEKQEIINAVLAAIRTNSKTISQLTAVNSMSDDDYLELSGGRKVSYAVLVAGLATSAQLTAAVEYLDQNKVGIKTDGLADWTKCRVVYLDGMGNIDGGGTSGNGIYYTPGDKKIRDYNNSQAPQFPISGAVYISKISLRSYTWDGNDLVEIGEYVKNRQVIDYISSVPSFESMEIGTMYYVNDSHKLAIKTSESTTYTFDPNPNLVYAARNTKKSYIWDAGNNVWLLLGQS